MKSVLDDPRLYQQIDPVDIYDSLSKIGRQFESGWHDAQFTNLNFDVSDVQNIIVAGMGGSNLAAKFVHSLSPLLLAVPFEIVANYRLPAYAGINTLVILSSYSGNTEETLSCAQDAVRRGCKTVVLTTGGKLKEFAIDEHLPLTLLDEKFNTSHVPRVGLGISLGALLSLLVRLNQKAYTHFDPKEIARTIERSFDGVSKARPLEENPAKILAQKHRGQGIIIYAANHLEGVSKVASNFFNESAKTFSTAFAIPDLNHHLMEGMDFPHSLKENLGIFLLNSTSYPDIIQKRLQITKEILLKQNYHVTVVKPETDNLVLQTFESLVFLIMFSYYLSIANKVNPGTNPWVDYFKNKLSH